MYHKGPYLDPFFFIIYINGLLNINVDANIVCFADDTVILLNEKSIDELYTKANQVFDTINSWFNNNFLELNLTKSKYIVFNLQNTNSNNENKLCLHTTLCLINKYNNCNNCLNIEKVDSIKYLGLFIDFQLKWVSHISYILRLSRKFFFVFYDLRYIFNNQLFHLGLRYGEPPTMSI